MGMVRLFGFCVAFLFASSVTAANIIDLGPSDYRSYGPNASHTGAGVRSSFGQTIRMPPTSLNTLTVTRNAVVPYASAAARMRPFLSVHPLSAAASAAVAGLFVAMEWYFDEDLGEWAVREVESVPPIEGTGFIHSSISSSCPAAGPFPTATAACEAGASCLNRNLVSVDHRNGRFYTCDVSTPSNTYTFLASAPDISCPPGTDYNVNEGHCEQYVSVPVGSDYSRLAGELPGFAASEVAQATADAQERFGIAPNYHDQVMSGPSIVSGPVTVTSVVDPVTGTTLTINQSTETSLSYGPETITTADTTTTTTYENGVETSTEVVTETPGELPVRPNPPASEIEFPAFCTWASAVCGWINWTQEEPPPDNDLPQVVDDDFYTEKNISFGSKSCPEPYQISLAPFMDTQVSVSFQPLCDFAGLIYFMVMAASYIIAAYISIGVARA